MKKLYLIRHAKSDWDDCSLDDFDRHLSKRGLKNAPFMGKLLKKKKTSVDLIISSSAKRAKDTAVLISQEILYKKEIVFSDNIYEASLSCLLEILKNIKNKNKTVFLIGHNPSLNALAYNLCKFEDNIVTSGILELELDISSWSEISYCQGKIISFEYPKKY